MITWLEIFFPQYDKNEIKNVINIFKEVYDIITISVNSRINDILDSENKKKLINTKLQETFPWYNKELITHLKKYVDNLNNDVILNEIVEDLLIQKNSNEMMKSDYLLIWNNLNEYLKTAVSIWINDNSNTTSADLKNKYNDTISNPSIYNYEENYKYWLSEKLLCLEKLSISELEEKTSIYINHAIDHILQIFNSITSYEKQYLKSSIFNEIHSKSKNISFFDLFKLYYQQEKLWKKAEIDYKSSQKSDIKKELYLRYIEDIKKSQYEIQRIFALTNIYINRERTLTFQNAEEEKDFLISKIAEIWSKERKELYLKENNNKNDSLYNYTIKKDLWWQWDNKWKKYLFSNSKQKWYTREEFHSFEIEWKYNNYNKKKKKINLLHIKNRIIKAEYSSTEKFLRKWLSSFNEILDHKWFIFVVEDLHKDSQRLINIIKNELSTWETSWLEKPENMKEAWNENTNEDYESIKWTIKISYKWKLIKYFFDLLWEILTNNKLSNLKQIFETIKIANIGSDDLNEYKDLVEKINNPILNDLYLDLKRKFRKKEYFIEVEIQIFDTINYIKAEVDKNSPAFHWKYKKLKTISTLWIYFPYSIYWENIKQVLIDEIPNTEKYKFLKEE